VGILGKRPAAEGESSRALPVCFKFVQGKGAIYPAIRSIRHCFNQGGTGRHTLIHLRCFAQMRQRKSSTSGDWRLQKISEATHLRLDRSPSSSQPFGGAEIMKIRWLNIHSLDSILARGN